jgi:transposase-like protein
MPPTATYQDIKAYQDLVQHNEISAKILPPCPRCRVESMHFKLHAYRERCFLIIVEMLIRTVYCPLLRFKCPGCGKTVTYYPDFAIPYKRYTRQTIMGYAGTYVQNEKMTYQGAVASQNGIPGYDDSDRTLAPSTVHRWISDLSALAGTCRTALSLLLQANPMSDICRDLAQIVVPSNKYRSKQRKNQLMGVRKLTMVEAFFQSAFAKSTFTKLAISCGFT